MAQIEPVIQKTQVVLLRERISKNNKEINRLVNDVKRCNHALFKLAKAGVVE